MIRKIRRFFEQHGKHISTVALVFGFIFDFFTLTRIDRLYDNLVFAFYLTVAGSGVLLFNLIESRGTRTSFLKNLHAFLPVLVQFAFGGLFSGISIFYLRSSTFSVNILFVATLFGLLIGNEFFRQKYTRLVFQATMFYFVLYSYLIFSLPVLFKSIGPAIFLLSGVVSLGMMAGFSLLFKRFVSVRFEASKKQLFIAVGGIFIIMNIFYFLNVIPPIPLSLKDVDAYQKVYRSGDAYIALEEHRWFNLFDTIQIMEGQSVFVFSSVFSPTDLDTKIVHHWQYFDEDIDRWVSAGRIIFPIVGGRGGGFRGYTQKDALFPGAWRVDVETERGQLIGRETFRIEFVEAAPELFEKIL